MESGDNFKHIDVSFDILNDKCTIFTAGIKMILEQLLEPIYIKPRFGDLPCMEEREHQLHFIFMKMMNGKHLQNIYKFIH